MKLEGLDCATQYEIRVREWRAGAWRDQQTYTRTTAACPAPPTASFTYSPSSPQAGQTVTFDASGSTCPQAPCTYTWDDTPPGGSVWPLGTGQTMTFTFSGAGTKYVRLTVTGSDGQTATTLQQVTVTAAAPTPTPTPEPTPEPTATPTPTPTPPPGGTRTNRCFSDPGACGFPDPDYGTAGVEPGTNLTPSGSITVTTPGAVIENLEVRGSIRVAAPDVTIRNVRLIGTGCGGSPSSPCQWLILNDGTYTTTISHVEFTATMPTTVVFGVRNDGSGHVKIDHAYHHGSVSSLCYCGSDSTGGFGTITDSYSIIEDQYIPGDHLENIYADDSTLTARHNVLLNREPQTSTIFGNSSNGFGGPCKNRFVIDGNLLAGGGQMLTGCAHMTSNGTSDIRITNNRFARCADGREVQGGGGTWLCPNGPDEDGYYPRGGSFMVCTEVPSTAIISGNVWDKDDSDADSAC